MPLYKIQILDSLNIVAIGDAISTSTNGGITFYSGYGTYYSPTKGLDLITLDSGFVCGYKGIGRLDTLFPYNNSNITRLPYNIYNLKNLIVIDNYKCWITGGADNYYEPTQTVYKTTDLGNNWVLNSVFNNIDISGITFLNTNTGYITGYGSGFGLMLKTTNSGANWNTIIIDSSYNNNYSGDLRFFQNRLYTNSGFKIQYTTNEGTNWIEVPGLVKNYSYWSNYEVAGLNTYYTTLFSATDNIFRTTNGGQKWDTLVHYLYDTQWKDIHFLNEKTGFFVGNRSSVLKTTNGGSLFVMETGANTDLVLNSVYMSDSNNVWIAGNSGIIFNSTDGGVNWTTQTSGVATNLTMVRFHNNNSGWIIGNNGIILHTTTGGKYWNNPSGEIPTRFNLYQNFPNPFNPKTKIKFELPFSSNIKLIIYDVTGEKIITLIDQSYNPGIFDIEWDASGIASGIYFYQLQTDLFTQSKKMVLVK